MFAVLAEPFAGTFLIQPKIFEDHRGDFVKTFHRDSFAALGLDFVVTEEFYSTSRRGVIRGMHFQLPPHDHAKLVYCVRGRVLDVLVDLRKSSKTYGQVASAEFTGENRHMFFIPRGIGHGFLALEDDSVMVYKTSTVHAPSHDAGVRWDSIGFDWGSDRPVTSARDDSFPALREFVSPF